MASMKEKDGCFSGLKESESTEVVPVHQKQVAVSPKRDVVKSTAVVKFSATKFPVQFSKLSMNTNLNDAPDNWLCSQSHEEQHLRDLPWQRRHSECSSFAMANCYPDLAGEVDVVSDAENIKRLLKIPYENSHASLMVHRVGRTLLLDNFDIHKHLLRQESETWVWLRQFFKNSVVKSEDELKCVPRQLKTQAALQKQMMYSKFLYKSLAESRRQGIERSQVERHHQVSPVPSPSPIIPHFVADLTPAIDSVHFDGAGEFHRQTVWTFEDLRMLIGTDLPVFSVGDHPCVSLRLRSVARYSVRYRTMLGDGDSVAFNAVRELQPYGPTRPVTKLECVNHVHKRMGTALRNATKEERLGGRGQGRLTLDKCTRLQYYFRGAVLDNLRSVEAMKRAIWATFFHCTSTDEDPHHNQCPAGEDSWCFVRRAEARGEQPGAHEENVGTALSRDVASALIPIYRRFTAPVLLKRTLHGQTQNANESLHSLVWHYCPKTAFVGKTRLEAAVHHAVSKFNRGNQHLALVMENINIPSTEKTRRLLDQEDQKRLHKAEAAARETGATRRQARRAERREDLVQQEAREGHTYGPGLMEDRETAQPINVVTGLDYWLDNLMCNVPEVAMCYHDGGFVQKYELIKTEDIPKLESCKFSPQTVKYVATNILSFLRNSATKEGHTYWLYKCKRSDLVKLYDLTDLCGNTVPNKGVTPFTIPVAMLLYRLARKLRLKPGNYTRHIPQIKALLHTSLQLLDEAEHAEVVTSSLYLLSDLYIPDGCLHNEWVDVKREDTSEQSSEEDEEEEEEGEEEEQSETSVSVKDLLNIPRGNLHPERRARLEGITGTPDERCKDGLQCMRRGLSCLERDLQAKTLQSQHTSSSIVEEQLTCNASEAIPLHYEPIQLATTTNSKVLVQRPPMTSQAMPETWHTLTKALLLRKACMAYYVLASELLSNKQYGCSLKYVRYAIHCFESMSVLKPSKKADNGYLLMLVLLATSELRHHLAIGGVSDEHQRGYNDMSEEDTFILDSAQSIVSLPEMAWVYKWTTNRSENLRIALRCLDTIRELARHEDQTLAVKTLMQDVIKKTSAICNELGKMAMGHTETLMNSGSTFPEIDSVWKQSMGLFERGLEGFCKVKDQKNEAIVLLNIVRLHKIAAQTYISAMEAGSQHFSGPERHHFEEALECYRKAGQCLDNSPAHAQLRNNILWDFSSTYLTLGMYLQRYPPSSPSDLAKIHQEVAELYRKAIKKCNQISVQPGEELWNCCKDRVATLEYNLAEVHISSYREQTTYGRQQKVFGQAEGSFKRAAELFVQAGKSYKLLQLQCKRLAFYNSHYNSGEDNPSVLDTMLTLITDCELPLLAAASSGFLDKDKLSAECQDPDTLLGYLLRPTLIVLRQLLKSATLLKKGNEQQQLKELYKKSLELQNQLKIKDENLTLESKYTLMAQLCTQIKQQYVCI